MNQEKTTPKDFFLHLGAIISLFASIISLITLLFTLIDYYSPDGLAGAVYSTQISWSVSILIVLIPVLYILERLIHKDINLDPEKAEILLNRTRIYATLFFSGVTIIIDLITLIYNYLNGELTIRFFYKCLAIIIILGIIFAYYLYEKRNTNKTIRIIMSYSFLFISLVSIVLAFTVVGSPFKQRYIRLDSQRINDLNNIVYNMNYYWQNNGKLPTSLKDLGNNQTLFNVPIDPETRQPYEYHIVNEFGQMGPSYQLCADFSLGTPNNKDILQYNTYNYYGNNEQWYHDKGRYCFDRKIDINKYPVNKDSIRGI